MPPGSSIPHSTVEDESDDEGAAGKASEDDEEGSEVGEDDDEDGEDIQDSENAEVSNDEEVDDLEAPRRRSARNQREPSTSDLGQKTKRKVLKPVLEKLGQHKKGYKGG